MTDKKKQAVNDAKFRLTEWFGEIEGAAYSYCVKFSYFD